MGVGWNPIGFHLLSFLCLGPAFMIQERLAINSDGLALLEFRARIRSDPYNALGNWNSSDSTPCMWFGVHCIESKVQMLDLSALSLEGTLAPELGKLGDLRSLVIYKNHFSNPIPKEFGDLTKLELLDLRENNLSGRIPAEIGRMSSLRRLLLCDNKFEGHIPSDLGKLTLLSEMPFDENLTSMLTTRTSCVNRKFGLCILQSNLKQLKKAESLLISIKGALIHYLKSLLFPLFKLRKETQGEYQGSYVAGSSGQQLPAPFARRRLLEQSKNLPVPDAPDHSGSSNEQIISLPTTRSSGTFPAVPKATTKQAPAPASETINSEPAVQPSPTSNAEPTAQQSSASTNLWKFLIAIPCVLALLVYVAMLFMCRKQAAKSICPWTTGLSGQLQKAFVTGVPKLNRSELETACEDFSNIIDTVEGSTVYKGTLSSGVEIAVVASVNISSSKEWLKSSEMAYRRKIDTLSRVNHKNFVNLIGYCEEDEPFSRMMVFEYAPNGSIFEHLHIKEMEHLDWCARMRIVMGVAYCLQYMHHDLNPPVTHTNLNSATVFLTDDYAAKVSDIYLLPATSSKTSSDGESKHSELPPITDPEANVYSFGILLLELISGKLPCSEEHGAIEKWAAEYLGDRRRISDMIDPMLKSFKNNELDEICEVIRECIQVDPRHRPTMKEVTHKLKAVINIPPEQASPRLSPLWWAELEIISMEAT